MRLLLLSLVLTGCGYVHPYVGMSTKQWMLVQAGAQIDCPVEDLKYTENPEYYRVTGCGQVARCERVEMASNWECVAERPRVANSNFP